MASNPPDEFESFEKLPAAGLADTGSFLAGTFEQQYEALFAEALEEGEISPEERHRLDLAAAALGLDADRVRRLENALLAAYEGHAAITLVDRADPSGLADRPHEPVRAPSLYDVDEDRPTPIAFHTPIKDENALLHERFLAGGIATRASARCRCSCDGSKRRGTRRASTRSTGPRRRRGRRGRSRPTIGTSCFIPTRIDAPATCSR